MPGQMKSSLPQYGTPSLLPPVGQLQGRGICTLSYGTNSLTFRTNPNEITWDYELITHIDQTYGGRVVQILGVKMDNLVVKVDCGQGGWPYAMEVVGFMRDLMVNQRNGQPATFTYTTRNWNLKVFALNIPFGDSVTETVRELELRFKIQEDISKQNVAASISDALSALQESIGWVASGFNNVDAVAAAPNPNANGGVTTTTPTSTAQAAVQQATSSITSGDLGIPGLGALFGGIGI